MSNIDRVGSLVSRLVLLLMAALIGACGGGGGGGTDSGSTSIPAMYSLGGSIGGLSGSGLTLSNGTQTVSPAVGATSFVFTNGLASGSSYSVTVSTSPSGLNCSVSNAVGSVGSVDVSSVQVVCSAQSYSLGGSISGLVASGLVLANGTDTLVVASGATNFTMPAPVAYDRAFAISVTTQPAGANCTVGNGAGTMSAGNIGNVSVICSPQSHTLGGTISGLTTSGLVLTNGSSSLNVISGSTNFTMPTQVAYGSPFAVRVSTQPGGLTCGVSNGTGTMLAADVSNVVVICNALTYGLSGTISGLTASGLVLANGAVLNSVVAFNQTFTMGSLPSGASYDIVVQTQPAGLFCQVTNGSGTVRSSVIANISVDCGPSGLSGWARMAGANTGGAYGTLGIAAPGNVPGVRDNSVSWIDNTGDLWLFGGATNSGPGGKWNDLWKYSQATGFWTWMSGSSTSGAVGVYGTVGSAAAGNVPGARAWASSWKDSSGNFWLFGGAGQCWFNDLWKYSPSTGLWTWMAGPSPSTSCVGPGVYGTQGVPAANNVPARRTGAISWTDGAGNLWLFGGEGLAGFLNDLWKYNPSTGLWVWVSGSNSAGAGAVYGTKGIAAPNNVPGARAWSVGWADSSGSLWLFGGNANRGSMNDLWKYSPLSGTWTWISGSSAVNVAPVYGTKGVAAVSNEPGGKSAASSWLDTSGNFWLFGGGSNDLWKYTPSTGMWTWTSGSQGSGASSNGIQGLPAPTNTPGDRQGAITWIDGSGRLWLFAGSWSPAGQLTYTNQLWRYTP